MPEPTIESVVKQEGRESTQVQSGPTIAGGTGERLVAGSGRLPGAWNPNENPLPDIDALRAQQQLQQAITSKNKKEIKKSLADLQKQVQYVIEQLKNKDTEQSQKPKLVKLRQTMSGPMNKGKNSLHELAMEKAERELQIACGVRTEELKERVLSRETIKEEKE